MKKKIAILGSTGSIGKTLIEIIKKDKKNFDIILLTADKNYKEIFKQAKILNVKNLIITNKKSYKELKKRKLGNINILIITTHLIIFLNFVLGISFNGPPEAVRYIFSIFEVLCPPKA